MGIDILTLAAARAGKGSGGSASKYKQPAWGAEGEKTILAENTYEIDAESMMGVIVKPFSLVEGAEYIVNYNGVEYKCVAVAADNGNGGTNFFLGNVGAAIGGEPTEEPFVIVRVSDKEASESGYYGAVMEFGGSASVTLSIRSNIVHKIPKEYVESPTDPLIVELFDEGTELRYMPEYDEIEKALDDGRVVRAKRTDRSGNGMYAYAGSSHGKIDFIAPDGSINEWGIERITLNPSGTAQEMLFKFVPESN